MGQVYDFSETAAVHLRIEDYEYDADYREEYLHDDSCVGRQPSPYSRDQGCSCCSLHECKKRCSLFGYRIKERDMQEIEILGYDQSGSYGIKKLDYAGKEEYNTCDESTETLQAQYDVFHLKVLYRFITMSTVCLTFSKIAPGGSISPYSSEQSMRMKFGSSSHCLR